MSTSSKASKANPAVDNGDPTGAGVSRHPAPSDVALTLATQLAAGPILDYVANKNGHLDDCSLCGDPLPTATPPAAGLPPAHDVVRHHVRNGLLAICGTCAATFFVNAKPGSLPSAVAGALGSIINASGASVESATANLRTVCHSEVTADDVRALFCDLPASNWTIKLLLRLEWHPATTLVGDRVTDIPPNTPYAAFMVHSANFLIGMGSYLKPATKRRVTTRASKHGGRYLSVATSAARECGDPATAFELPIKDLLSHGDNDVTLWSVVYAELVATQPLATVTSAERLQLLHMYGQFVARAARLDEINSAGGFIDDAAAHAELAALIDQFLSYIAAPFRLPISLGFSSPRHRVSVSFDGTANLCFTMAGWVARIATTNVYLPS